MRKVDWRSAEGPVVCHVEALREFAEVVEWDSDPSPDAVALSDLFGVEPPRAEANLRVGEFVAVVQVPKPKSEFENVVKAALAELDLALVVKKGDRVFVEPAFKVESGFAVLSDPLKVAEEMSSEIGHPVAIVKEVPGPCCWLPAPLAWTGNFLTDAGKGVPPRFYSSFYFPGPGCWEVDGEVEWERGEGLPKEALGFFKSKLSHKLLAKFYKIRRLQLKLLYRLGCEECLYRMGER